MERRGKRLSHSAPKAKLDVIGRGAAMVRDDGSQPHPVVAFPASAAGVRKANMRFANMRLGSGRRTLVVRQAGGPIVDASKLSGEPVIRIRQACERGDAYIRQLSAHCRQPVPGTIVSEADIAHYLPVCEADAKLFCVGLNYVGHADELGLAIPKQPAIFARYGTTCVGHDQPIMLP